MSGSTAEHSFRKYSRHTDHMTNKTSQSVSIIVEAFPLVNNDTKIQNVEVQSMTYTPSVTLISKSKLLYNKTVSRCCNIDMWVNMITYTAIACFILFVILAFLSFIVMPILGLIHSSGDTKSERKDTMMLILIIIFTPLEISVIFSIIAIILDKCSSNRLSNYI